MKLLIIMIPTWICFEKIILKVKMIPGCWWLIPVILATQKAEFRGIMNYLPRLDHISKNTQHIQKRIVKWLKW
jgi:hypothetical protein